MSSGSSSRPPPPPPPRPPAPPPPPSSSSSPPPSYLESQQHLQQHKRRTSNTYGIHDGQAAGPAWLYHNPQQSQFNSPFSSLHYQDISQTRSPDLLLDEPAQVLCPNCNQLVFTDTSHHMGCLAYSVSFTFLLLCCLPCAVVPCFVSALKDVRHSCPNCGNVVAVYKRR